MHRINRNNQKVKRLNLLYICILCLLTSSCHIGRFFYYNYADVNDYKKFPQVPINRNTKAYTFMDYGKRVVLPPMTVENKTVPFDTYLSDNKTLAFLIIRNDSILYQYYDEDYDTSSIFPSFSMAKSVVSALVGIAIDEGAINDENDPVIKYLPELDKSLAPVTLLHLLSMRSGIKYDESYSNPWADMPKYYYGSNLRKYILKLKAAEAPDLHYNYQSVNTLLLALCVERATHMPINQYLEQKLWKPMGMEYNASWNIDSHRNNTIKAYCCLNARTSDFAKIGRLYLHKGNWNGTQLISEDWINKSLTITNDSKDSRGYSYVYQWRVLPTGQFFAKGILGQYIYCNPKTKLIIVRLGKSDSGIDWVKVFQRLNM